jgi:type II secretory pathway component GspD/PulD (secretin)
MFKPFYQVLEEQASLEEKTASKVTVTLTASDMPLVEFLRYIADKAGISIVCDEALDERVVNVSVKDTDVTDVLSAVARRYGVDITEQGGVYYIGTLQAQDRAILVRKVKRLSAKEITDMVGTICSEVGRVSASNDGLTVVGDRVRVLQNINSMFNQVESAQTNTWVLQMYLISGTNSVSREIGFDTTATFDLAASFAAAKSKLDTLGAFNAVLRAARSNSQYEIIAEPMMLLTDGGSGSIQDGETIPIPHRTVSDAGTVTTTGYEYVKTGIVINTALREMSSRAATCNIVIDLTQVTSYVDSAPVTSGQNFKTTAVLESGGTYLVGSLSRRSSRNEKKGAFFDTLSDKDDTGGNIEVWLRCYRIQGSYQPKVTPAAISATP